MEKDKCIVCFDEYIKYIKICDKCNLLYCENCVSKLNNNCVICKRIESNNLNNLNNFDEQIYIFSDEFEFEYNLSMQFFWFYVNNWLYYFAVGIILFPLFIYSIICYNTIFGRKNFI